MKTVSFEYLCRRTMTPESIARSDARFEREYKKYKLRQLRKSLGITQKQLAEALKISQPGLSQIENSADMQLTTLRQVVHALGGELDVIARFLDRIVAIQVAA